MGPSNPLRIPGFEVLSPLGRGGMGSVYRARDVKMDRIVALKVIDPSTAADDRFLARFHKEIRAAGRLFHPNIVASYDAGEADGYHYISMECVEGESVQSAIKRKGRLPEREALSIALHVARALDHAHHLGISHRDVKPGNILLAPDGASKLALPVAKLCDFGLARVLDGSASLTRTGSLLGTPWYMAPEQGEDGLNPRADVYALGATLYHMLVGEPPFDGPSALTILMKHVMEPRPPVREKRPEVSAETEAIVLKAMAKEPEERYKSASRMAAAIEAAMAPRAAPRAAPTPAARATPTPAPRATPPPAVVPPPARPTTRPRRPRRAWVLPLVAVLAVASAIAWQASTPVTRPTETPAPPPATAAAAPPVAAPPVVSEAPLTPAGDPVDPRKAREAEAAGLLVPLEVEAKRLAAEGKPADAAAVFDRFPKELSSTDAGKKAASAARAYGAEARRKGIDAVLGKADDLAAIGRFDDARGLLEGLLASLDASERAPIDEKMASIEAARPAWEASRSAKAEEGYDAFRKRLFPLARDRKFAEARAEIDRARKDDALVPKLEAIDADLADLALLEAVYEDARAGALRLAETGKTARLRKFDAEVRFRVEGDRLFFDVGGARIAVQLELLDRPDIATLALAAVHPGDAEARLKIGLLLVHGLDPVAPSKESLAPAKAEFETAARKDRRADRWLARIAAMEALLAAGQTQPPGAGDVAPEAIERLFAVRPGTAKPGGEVDIRYDFASEDQAKDWEAWAFTQGGAAMPAGEWRVIEGEVLGRGHRSLYWKAKMAGDLLVEGTLTPEETTNAGIQVCDDRAGKAYRAAIGYQLSLPAPLRAALATRPTCLVRLDLARLLDMGAADAASQARLLREAHATLGGSESPTLRVGTKYGVRLTRIGEVLTLEVDGRVVARAKDGAYRGGFVALYCDTQPASAAEVSLSWDDIHIVGQLDPVWLSAELAK